MNGMENVYDDLGLSKTSLYGLINRQKLPNVKAVIESRSQYFREIGEELNISRKFICLILVNSVGLRCVLARLVSIRLTFPQQQQFCKRA